MIAIMCCSDVSAALAQLLCWLGAKCWIYVEQQPKKLEESSFFVKNNWICLPSSSVTIKVDSYKLLYQCHL